VSETPRSRPDAWLAAVWGLIVRIALFVAVAYVLYRIRVVIIVVLMAVMLAFAVAPLVDWIRRSPLFRSLPRDWRRTAAAGVVFVLLAIGLVELVMLIVRPLRAEIELMVANWGEHQKTVSKWMTDARHWFEGLPPDIQQAVKNLKFDEMIRGFGEQVHHFLLRTLESGWYLVEMILIPVLAFSFLTESRPLKREFAITLPRHRLRDGLYVLQQTSRILQSYTIGQLILALIAGVVVWLLMTVMGMKYALAMAMVAAVTRVIPVIGPLLGGIPIVLICALQGTDKALVFLVAFTVMHLIESKVIMPRLIGYRIKLHPAVVIVVLLIGAEFFGMWGMFLAAPVAAVAKALFHYFVIRPRTGKPLLPPAPQAPPTAEAPQKEVQVGRPSIAGVGDHSRAH
jgi:predicted PurR-regulated permease PerM